MIFCNQIESSCLLGDLIDAGIAELQTGPFGTMLNAKEYTQSGVPVIAVQNIDENNLNWDNLVYVSDKTAERLSKYRVFTGDIIFGRKGAVERRALIRESEHGWIQGSDCIRLRVNKDISSEFLSYQLGSPKIKQWILTNAHGTTMPSLNQEILRRLPLFLPPLPVQKKIAAILSSLDDKIAINTRMNKVLEETARALFHRWFVEFEFPNDEGKPYKSSGGRMIASEMGEIPEGWRVGTVGDVVQIFGGSTPNTKNLDYWENGEHPFCTPKDLSTLSTSILLDTERHITDKGVQTISSKQLPPGTLLLSSRAPVGYLAISAVPISVNQGFIAMVCNETISNVYVLQWIQENMDEIKGRANGSTFLEISKRNFRGIPFLIPAEPVLSSYNRSVKPLYDFVENIARENVRLRTLRDELLSKLMAS